jgi:hypothetical protein
MTTVVQGHDITRFLHNVYHFSQILFLCDWIYGFFIRFTPSGQACCGTWDQKFVDGELYQQGLFILVAGCIVGAVVFMSLFNAMLRSLNKNDTF